MKRKINPTNEREYLIKKLSILTVHRDQTLDKMTYVQSSQLDKELERTLQLINQIETTLGEDKLHPLQRDQKRDIRRTFSLKTANWSKMSLDIWALTAGFLHKAEIAKLTSISTLFVHVYMKYIRLSYQQLFADFKFHAPRSYPLVTARTQLCLFNENIREYDSYYNLIDRSYLALFQDLKNNDQESAINFIRNKLRLTADTQENVTDMVFYQKRGDGHTPITLAQSLNLTEFLDFCYEKLILEGHIINKNKYSLVQTGYLPFILEDLETNMSAQALWAYAGASVCNKQGICAEISEKKAWEKTWIDEMSKDAHLRISLSTIAAMLSSDNLLIYTLDNIRPNEIEDQMMHSTGYYSELHNQEKGIYYNEFIFYAFPLNVAIVGKNIQMINRLLPLTQSCLTGNDESLVEKYQVVLMAFYIQNRNLAGLTQVLTNGGIEFLTTNIGVYAKYFQIYFDSEGERFSVIDLVMESGWQQGIATVMSYGAQFAGTLGTENVSPLYYAIIYEDLELVKLLRKYHVSLTDKFVSSPSDYDCMIYPLIYSLVNNHPAIAEYIIEEIGAKVACQQIDDTLESGEGFVARERESLLATKASLIKVTGSSSLVTNSLLAQNHSTGAVQSQSTLALFRAM